MQPVAYLGLFIIALTLLEAFETVVLPRRVTRWFRFTRMFYVLTWRPWKWVARRISGVRQRETFLSFYGPLSLLVLFVLWGLACGQSRPHGGQGMDIAPPADASCWRDRF